MKQTVYVCDKVCENCLSEYRCPLSIPHLHADGKTRHIGCPIDSGSMKCEEYELTVSFKEAEYSYGREFGATKKGV